MANKRNGDDDFTPDDIGRAARRLGQALSTRLAQVLILLGVIYVAWASYYQIQPEEVGLITRFGAYQGTSEPGPHFKCDQSIAVSVLQWPEPHPSCAGCPARTCPALR